MASTSAPSPSGDTFGWLQSLGKGSLGKVAYLVVEWICKQVGITNIPGSAKRELSAKEFMNFVKDGVALAKLANVLRPGSVPNIFSSPKDKSSQLSNLTNFLGFARNFGGVSDGDLFKAEDANKGKGFPNVLNTLISLGGNAASKFGKDGLNMEQLASTAMQGAGKGFLGNLLGKLGLGKK